MGLFVALAAAAVPRAVPAQHGGVSAQVAAPDGQPQKFIDVVTITAGERYAAGSLMRTFFGTRYRDLWTTPIQVPVLNLERYAGGLKPRELGGGMQTTSLHFDSGDGREFTFRSLDKDPTPAVPEPFRGTVVNRLVQDAISSMNPAGALVAAELLGAAGVLRAEPESRRVHAAVGASLWLSFFEPRNRVSLAWASGDEGGRWYLRSALGF